MKRQGISTIVQCAWSLFLVFNSVGLFAQVQVGQTIFEVNQADEFGASTAIAANGNRIAIGNPVFDGDEPDLGQVQLYDFVNGDWLSIGSIEGNFPSGNAGLQIELSDDGNRLAIAAPEAGVNVAFEGQVSIYAYDGANWNLLGNPISGTAPSERLGTNIAFSGDGNTIACYSADNSLNSRVKLFRYDGSDWNPFGEILGGTMDQGCFGCDMDLSVDGNTIIIGAYTSAESGIDRGKAEIHRYEGQWQQFGQTFYGSVAGHLLGRGVAISGKGNRIALGVSGYAGNFINNGAVFTFDFVGGIWNFAGSFIIGASQNEQCGLSLALSNSGERLILGCPNFPNSEANGRIQIYEWLNNDWGVLGMPINFESILGAGFGTNLDISPDGSRVIAAAPFLNDPNNFGEVRVYEFQVVNTEEPVRGSSIELAPNPVSDQVQILGLAGQPAQVQIFNPYGQRLETHLAVESL
ncbi:MAG: hypothetical protein AAFV80_22885, partial [Bacteroidota bacterium]